MVGRELAQPVPAATGAQRAVANSRSMCAHFAAGAGRPGVPLPAATRRDRRPGRPGRAGAARDRPRSGRVQLPPAARVVKNDDATARARRSALPIVAAAAGGHSASCPRTARPEGLYPAALDRPEHRARHAARRVDVFASARSTASASFADADHELRARDDHQTVSSLSGGNQQKVMIGRWLASDVDTLLIEEPTRGVDVGAKAEIYGLLREFRRRGRRGADHVERTDRAPRPLRPHPRGARRSDRRELTAAEASEELIMRTR